MTEGDSNERHFRGRVAPEKELREKRAMIANMTPAQKAEQRQGFFSKRSAAHTPPVEEEAIPEPGTHDYSKWLLRQKLGR